MVVVGVGVGSKIQWFGALFVVVSGVVVGSRIPWFGALLVVVAIGL